MLITQLLFHFLIAVIREMKEEIRARQEYLDTANDQIQVDAHQLNPNFLKSVGGKCNFIVIMFVVVQLKNVFHNE